MGTACGVNLNTLTLVLSLLLRCLPANHLTEEELGKTAEVFGDIIMSPSKHHYDIKNYEDRNAYDSEDESGESFGNFDEEEDYGHTDYGKYHKYGANDHRDSGKEYEKESGGKDDFYDEMGSAEGEKHSTKLQNSHGKKESGYGGKNMFDESNKSTGYRKVVSKVESDEKVEFHDDSDAGEYEKYDKEVDDHKKEVKKDHKDGEKVKKVDSREKLESDHGKSAHGERKENEGEVKKSGDDHKTSDNESNEKEGNNSEIDKEKDWSSRLKVKTVKKPNTKDESKDSSDKNSKKSEASKVSIKTIQKPIAKSKYSTAKTAEIKPNGSVLKPAVTNGKKSKVRPKHTEGTKSSKKPGIKFKDTINKAVVIKNDKLPEVVSRKLKRTQIGKNKRPEIKHKKTTNKSSDNKSTASSKTKVSPDKKTSYNSEKQTKIANQEKTTNQNIPESKSNARRKIVKIFWPKNVQDIILSDVAPKKEQKLENPQQTIQHDTVVTKGDDMFSFSDEFQDFVKTLESFG